VRILIVLSTYPPHFYGGGEVSALNLAQWLVGRGHEVGILTAADKNDAVLYGEMDDGLRVWRLPFPRPYMFWDHVKASKGLKPLWYLQDHFDPRNRRLMSAALDQFKPDLVQFHALAGIGYNTPREVAKRDIPALFFMHDLSLACFSGGMFKNGSVCERQCAECRVVSAIRFSSVTSIPRLAFCSPSRANLAKAATVLPLNKYKTAAIFNPNKYPPPTVQRTSADHVRLLYVGRLHKTKGVDLLLTVLEKLAPRYRFTIDLLGEGAESEALYTRFGHHPWCRFRGFVSEHEVSNAMIQSDVVCVPSIWNEPLGGVIVKALLLGLPVLGSRIGGIPEVIDDGKNGLLIAPGDSAAWEKAILLVLEQPSRLDQWSVYAKAHVDTFDQDVNGRKIEALCEEMMATAR
jgi:glycosyltransferase involved in cell wall biosynthesis